MKKTFNILKSVLCAWIVTVVLLLVLAFLMFRFETAEDKIGIGVIVVYLLSAFLGGFFAGRSMENRKFLWGMLAGMIYFAVLLLISVIVGEKVQLSGSGILTTLFLCLGGGMLGGMFS